MPDTLEVLVAAALPETRHIDEALVKVARESAAEVDVVPGEATELELVVPLAELDPAHPRVPLWARVAADPGFAAEHLAREAVDRLGPAAQYWLDRTTARYPRAGQDGLARLAAREAVRSAWALGLISGPGRGVAGVLGTAMTGTALAQRHAQLALKIAGVYGFDPTSRERAHDLLVILRVPRLTQPVPAAARNAGRLAASFALRRLAAQLVPFGAAAAGALIGLRSTQDVADRATAHYRRLATPGGRPHRNGR
jgi:hypothetical protein